MRLAIGMNFKGYGPMYLEIGLIIFLLCLCSMIWAAQPEVREMTNMGVKKSLNNIIITFLFRIDDRHWLHKSRDLDKSSFH